MKEDKIVRSLDIKPTFSTIQMNDIDFKLKKMEKMISKSLF